MSTLLPIDEARAIVLEAARALGQEEVAVADALGRVLAEDVSAALDVPPFDNSAMDGFLVAAGPAGRRLRITGESRAGAPAAAAPGPERALRISTGAVVPAGSDDHGVLPLEEATEAGGELVVGADVAPAQHVRRAGEDVRAGTVVLDAGTGLTAAGVGVAVIAGRAHLSCARRPRVAILATGDELREPGKPLGPGQIHDSNGITLAALVRDAGAQVLWHGTVGDEQRAVREAIGRALEDADVLLLSGGVSVGPHDHVKPALDALGVQERFWRVALRPGKPTWFGTRDETLVFGLPGNPVSAMVTFLLFARPALAKLQGADPARTRLTARVTESLPRNRARDEAVRVRLGDDPEGGGRRATPTGPQGSHQLTSMLGADGLAIVTAGKGALAPGAAVTVELI